MSWKDKVVGQLQAAPAAPVKFAAKLIVGAVVPGGSAVVELVGLSGSTASTRRSRTTSKSTNRGCRRRRRRRTSSAWKACWTS